MAVQPQVGKESTNVCIPQSVVETVGVMHACQQLPISVAPARVQMQCLQEDNAE